MRDALSISLFGFSVAAMPATAMAATEYAPPVRVVMSDEGPVLTTPDGMTLYQHSTENLASPKFAWMCSNVATTSFEDQQSGFGIRPTIGARYQKSCTEKYPPYTAPDGAVAGGDYSIAQRSDGSRQWAYKGFPLYRSVRDHAPGDRYGIAGGLFGPAAGGRFGGFRIAVQVTDLPAGLKLISRQQGLILAAKSNDRPIYTPRGGARLIKAGAGGGIDEFRPLLAPAIASVTGDWSIVTNAAGQRQYAFRGQPLFQAPDAVPDREISRRRGWLPVVAEKSAGRPSEIGQQLTLVGQAYATSTGRTLYIYNCQAGGAPGSNQRVAAVPCDDAGDPAGYMVSLCGDSQECSGRWRPYPASARARRIGDWAPIEITYPMFTDPRGALYPGDAPKVRVWANRGRPLFTYYEDEKPGDIWGDGVKGLWGSSFTALLLPGEAGALGE